jgi:hypothetical protein
VGSNPTSGTVLCKWQLNFRLTQSIKFAVFVPTRLNVLVVVNPLSWYLSLEKSQKVLGGDTLAKNVSTGRRGSKLVMRLTKSLKSFVWPLSTLKIHWSARKPMSSRKTWIFLVLRVLIRLSSDALSITPKLILSTLSVVRSTQKLKFATMLT